MHGLFILCFVVRAQRRKDEEKRNRKVQWGTLPGAHPNREMWVPYQENVI